MITQNLKGECYFIFKVALNWLIDTWVLHDYTALYAWNVKKKKSDQIIEVKYKSIQRSLPSVL